MVKKFVIGLIAAIAIYIAVCVAFVWGSPLTENNANDLQVVTTALAEDSLQIEDVLMSPLEELNGEDVQTVRYFVVNDSTYRTAIIKVKHDFMKYKFEEVLNKSID